MTDIITITQAQTMSSLQIAELTGKRHDEEALFVCSNASELDNATQTAYAVRDEKREDGFKYKVSRSTKKMRVVVSLTK